MRSPCCLRVCEIPLPPNNFRIPEPIFTKHGTHIMVSEPISTAYFINTSHKYVCTCIPTSLPGNGSVQTLPQQRTNTKQEKNQWSLLGNSSKHVTALLGNGFYIIVYAYESPNAFKPTFHIYKSKSRLMTASRSMHSWPRH
jgi:hypothetical protein